MVHEQDLLVITISRKLAAVKVRNEEVEAMGLRFQKSKLKTMHILKQDHQLGEKRRIKKRRKVEKSNTNI